MRNQEFSRQIVLPVEEWISTFFMFKSLFR